MDFDDPYASQLKIFYDPIVCREDFLSALEVHTQTDEI